MVQIMKKTIQYKILLQIKKANNLKKNQDITLDLKLCLLIFKVKLQIKKVKIKIQIQT